ncbi:ubiquitin related modifier 1 [Enteropsectra breve]|nr:ubiquitin related modifier 1 [Enteropsectra breve]
MKINFNGSENEELNMTTLTLNNKDIAANNIRTIEDVIKHVYKIEPRAHKSFYQSDKTLGHGTICLIDEQDLGMRNLSDKIDEDSSIVFISTLHGG